MFSAHNQQQLEVGRIGWRETDRQRASMRVRSNEIFIAGTKRPPYHLRSWETHQAHHLTRFLPALARKSVRCAVAVSCYPGVGPAKTMNAHQYGRWIQVAASTQIEKQSTIKESHRKPTHAFITIIICMTGCIQQWREVLVRSSNCKS